MISSSDDRITRTTITANDRGPHSIGFHVLDKNEFAVFVKDSAGAITSYTVDTHFSTASIPGDSGTFTFLDSVTVPAGDLVVYGVEELTQLLTSPMTDAAHERNYDKLVKLIQQNAEEINRAWKLARESTDTDVEVPEVAVADAGKVLGVDSAGALALLSSITGVDLTMSDIGQNIATAANAAAVRTLIGLVLGTDIYSKTAVDDAFTRIDGTKAFTGDQSMGSNKLTNVTDPTSAQDAATKNYVDGEQALSEIDTGAYIFLKDDFIIGNTPASSGTTGELGWEVVASGSGAQVEKVTTAESGRPGVAVFNTGTTTSGRGGINSGFSIRVGGGQIQFEWHVKLPALADGTDDYDFFCGLADDSQQVYSSLTDGIYFVYDRDQNTNWLIGAQASSTETVTDSGVAVGTGWIKLKAVVNADATSIEFFIDGSSVGTITTNIPTAANLRFGSAIDKEAGTTARLAHVDLFWMKQTLTSGR